jgi:hypothetical protein
MATATAMAMAMAMATAMATAMNRYGGHRYGGNRRMTPAKALLWCCCWSALHVGTATATAATVTAATAAAATAALGTVPAVPAATAPARSERAPAQNRLSTELGLTRMTGRSGPDCTGGIHYDDGSFEDGISAPVSNGIQVMSFDLPSNAAAIQQVCVALTRASASPGPDLAFSVELYAADGPGGTPGTLLGSVPATATGIPVTTTSTVNAQFYAVPIGPALALPAARTIYVGVQFDGAQHYFVAVDSSPTTPYRSSFASTDGGSTWQEEPTVDPGPFSAFGIRVDPVLSQTNCVPTSTAMCLLGDRFKVEATFQVTPSGPTGQAQAVRLTDDSGYLWFFAASNVEAIVKVLNGCALGNHYWVFAGGLTNVHTTIKVTDTQTGAFKTYDNPLNTPFKPLQDTSALPCP